MNSINYDVIPTICAAIVAVFAIQGITIYAVVKAVVLRRALADRREADVDGGDRERSKIHAPRAW